MLPLRCEPRSARPYHQHVVQPASSFFRILPFKEFYGLTAKVLSDGLGQVYRAGIPVRSHGVHQQPAVEYAHAPALLLCRSASGDRFASPDDIIDARVPQDALRKMRWKDEPVEIRRQIADLQNRRSLIRYFEHDVSRSW